MKRGGKKIPNRVRGAIRISPVTLALGKARQDGYDAGRAEGYEAGYKEGFAAGRESAQTVPSLPSTPSVPGVYSRPIAFQS